MTKAGGTPSPPSHRSSAPDRERHSAHAAARDKCHNRPIMRFFNTEGPVRPDKHYAIQLLDPVDVDEFLGLTQAERYFVRRKRDRAALPSGPVTCSGLSDPAVGQSSALNGSLMALRCLRRAASPPPSNAGSRPARGRSPVLCVRKEARFTSTLR